MTVPSIRALAPHLGISHTALNNHLRAGHFHAEPGGGFDIEKARVALGQENVKFMPVSGQNRAVEGSITTLQIEMWPIGRPVPYKKNARKWSPRAIETVANSIREFGFRQPVVVDVQDVIIIGHLRMKAAESLKLEQVPVHVARDLTPAQVRGLRIADNRTSQESTWDMDLLGPEMFELKAMDFDLSLTGFDVREIDGLLLSGGGGGAGLTDPDAIPDVPAVPVTHAGDLWLLGDHRVLCGDSTDKGATERLRGAEKANVVFTDPPYNVDYEGYTEEKLTIRGDKMSTVAFGEFLLSVFSILRESTTDAVSMYVCHGSSFQREFQNALEAAGFEVRCQIIWAKNTFAWGFGRYKFQHEPIFYCHVAGQKDAWYGDKSQSTLWQENKPAANRLHPTMKPIALVERALVNSSNPGDLVLDLFGGSGSTLIGCEATRRRSLIMEIDPKYVDVIVERWQAFTGKAATLEGDDRTFAALKVDRTIAVAA